VKAIKYTVLPHFAWWIPSAVPKLRFS
jgi:hypothetical protein